MAALHDRFSLDREILAALGLATAIATYLFSGVVLQTATIRADRTIRPSGGFKPLPGRVLIVKVLLGELVLGHGRSPMVKILAYVVCGVNYVIGTKVLRKMVKVAPQMIEAGVAVYAKWIDSSEWDYRKVYQAMHAQRSKRTPQSSQHRQRGR
jgi:hypothetical protein